MGCLTVNIISVSVPNACRVNAAGRNSGVAIMGDAVNWLTPQAIGRNKNVVSDAIPANTTIILSRKSVGMAVAITAALVCQVTPMGDYEYFYVVEGPLVVQDGYFMVKRNLD